VDKVDVEGLRELDAALGELGKSAGKAVLRRVGKKALKPVVEKARAIVPVDKGNLRDSIVVGTKLTKRQKRLNSRRVDRATIEVFAGANSPGDVAQEFGTVDLPPQPYMRPAWASEKNEVLNIVKRDLGEEIIKTAKRAAKRALKKAQQ
jgi:HK97 gp10 family phage protein